MTAEIEWVTGVLRVGRSFEEHGDPYDFSCTINRRGDCAELIGGNGKITPQIWRDVKEALIAQGVTHAQWDRLNNAPRSFLASSSNQVSIQPSDIQHYTLNS